VKHLNSIKNRRKKMIILKIHPQCLERIKHWTALAKGEVSALGIVKKDGDTLMVPEIYLPKQTCTPANTEMDPEDVARIMMDLEQRGIDATTLRLWLHSHADMKCFWSDTDDATIEALCNDGFIVSIVTNKAGDIKCRVDLFEPFRHTFHEVRVEPLLPEFNLLEQCKAEIMEKVSQGAAMISPGKHKQGELLIDFADDLHEENEYMALERKLHNGEITMSEYMAALDRWEGFV